MGRTRSPRGAPAPAKCKFCQIDFTPDEKPYISKQAGMEGDYHWKCFIEACRDRVPVSIGALDLPVASSEGEEPEVESAPASVEE